MKRSSAIALTLASASFLAGCEDTVETYSYDTVDACVAAGVFTQEACRKGLADARTQTDAVAPKFANLDDCADAFGAEQCKPAANAGGSTFFMPLMAGYLMGSIMSNAQVANQPLYRARSGGYFTAGGTEVTRKLGRSTPVRPSTVAAPKPTTTTLARGGFGAGRGGFSS